MSYAVPRPDKHQQLCCLQVDNYSLEGTLTGPFVFAANMFAFVLVVSCCRTGSPRLLWRRNVAVERLRIDG
jgi:hypothetical protein